MLDKETAEDESDVGAVSGEVGCAAGAEDADGEPSADVFSRNATADGSDISRILK